MPMRICFEVAGNRICPVIPPLVVLFDPFGPIEPPGPVEGPSPDPWIEARGIDARLANDLRAVATLRAVASKVMSPDLLRTAEPALQSMEKAVAARLPQGATLRAAG